MSNVPLPGPERHSAGHPQPTQVEGMQEFSRYKELVSRTVDAFGDEIRASRWLSMPNRDLDGRTPLEVAQNNGYDLEVLEPVLVRIEHGIDY
jgi:uncharacterized protein (DUF2384 family)